MGIFGSIIGSVANSIQDSSDSKYIEELKPKMMNSAIANDFEMWFEKKLELSPFLYSQYNYYDDCKRLVMIDDCYVIVSFGIEKKGSGIEKADVCDAVLYTFLGYESLSDNNISYSNGKPASKRVLIKAFAEVVREKIKEVLAKFDGDYPFGVIRYADGTDANISLLDHGAYFTYNVPKEEHKSAF